MTAKPAVVGGFILGALALGVAAIVLFGGQRLFTSTREVVVFFNESVAGLQVGAPVTFHGVPVGTVKTIALRVSTRDLSARIPVVLELQPDQISWEGEHLNGDDDTYQRLIAAGLRAQLAPQSIVTGQMRVDLDFKPGTSAALSGEPTDLPEIPAVASDLDELRDKVTELPLRDLVETAQKTLANVQALTSSLNTRIPTLTTSAEQSVAVATQTLVTTQEAVRQIQADASVTLKELSDLLADLHRQVDARGGELGKTLSAAERTARQAESLMISLNELAGPRARFRADLEAAARDLSASASSTRSFTRTLERDPSALLSGDTKR
ncbi:MlaD family protein [Rhodospirillum rubrum]|uniref:Mammalian cell entry related n=1 Tax=Rhodospirillum rubrum (strain ATCC 11170 / ATH 1.1.1 / DSM 467 / LMG 4362 / NCIMB 8255 / S1) TaxID=269796 RepID=Q2RRJ8_RHORT|nr:MlaD family protein [Rhodospirillum rubrum]ABC23247.1 Mammalian cell entry related [Rhodospirillum rubrum ATCC 11170]AEO48979.1 hypothetical protein F11_12575 [Rhodospirillum rubrum F11]MBK5954887.1 paraquat-inducible protein B [Rhodospirillum rubrum]QXG79222.1 MCE family protein [Rhodospirillum rubrum]HAP99607.1 MCE family protein [Rhodospirillum rubrum]